MPSGTTEITVVPSGTMEDPCSSTVEVLVVPSGTMEDLVVTRVQRRS